jgi:hypothetical protein
MTLLRKIAIIIVLIGICLPTATMPFITEFHPEPEICLTSNVFGNLGNMVVVFGGKYSTTGETITSILAVPYRYLFSTGVILICAGLFFRSFFRYI